VQDIYIE
jgi:hypothetical protein